jgi:hypothetical protein
VSELSFDLPSRQEDVAVDVYDADLQLVGRRLSSDRILVDPGTYFVIGRLPDGSELHTSVRVGEAEPARAELAPPAPPADDDLELYVDVPEPSAGRSIEEDRGELAAYELVAGGHWELVQRWPAYKLPESFEFSSFAVDAFALGHADRSRTWVRIPRRAAEYLEVDVREGHDGRARVAVSLAHRTARALLEYLDAGLLVEAALLADSPAVTAESLLYDKREDPVAAAAAAFALLRMGEIERLHTWTSNLSTWFPWLPDGLVAEAEHAAREGRHEDALRLLRQLPERGLPLLSMGLTYAADRLRMYVRLNPADVELRRQLDQLARYALATDFAEPVTTFHGDSPDSPHPSDQPPE